MARTWSSSTTARPALVSAHEPSPVMNPAAASTRREAASRSGSGARRRSASAAVLTGPPTSASSTPRSAAAATNCRRPAACPSRAARSRARRFPLRSTSTSTLGLGTLAIEHPLGRGRDGSAPRLLSSPSRSRSRLRGCGFPLVHHLDVEIAVADQDPDALTAAHATVQHQPREPVVDLALDGPAQRAGAELRLEPTFGQPADRLRGELHLDP